MIPVKAPRVAEVLPLMHLNGLSSGDFGPALTQFYGSSHGLSASTITRLTNESTFATEMKWLGVP